MYRKMVSRAAVALLALLVLGCSVAWATGSSSGPTLPPTDTPPAAALPTEPPPSEALDDTPIPQQRPEPPKPPVQEPLAVMLDLIVAAQPLHTGTVLLLGAAIAGSILLLGATGGRKGRPIR